MGFLSSLFGGLGNAMGGAANSIGSMLGGGGSSLMNMFSGGGQKQASPMQGMSNSNSGGSGLMNLFKNPIAQGGGLMGLGQLFGGKTKMPSFNTPAVQNLQNFSTNPPQLPQSMQDEINKSMAIQEDEENRNLRNVYKNARPGTDYTTDSAYQRDASNLQRNQTSNRVNAMITPTMQYLQPQQQNLSELAQLSISEIMAQTGMKSSEAQQIKDMFSNVGGQFINKGLFPDAYSMNPMGMFGSK